MTTTQELVKSYYGRELTGSQDLKTSACCDATTVPPWLRPLLAGIHPEVLARYYGCGLVAPHELRGRRVLDLGCGSGRDVYALAQLVGPEGCVVGVDMTREQLEVARAHQAHHAERFGFDNLRFLEGDIERLAELELEPASFDVVVSNCVVNLAEDKAAVLRGARALLKEGGEFYFADVYADRRLPAELRADRVLYGECLGGALYWNDFLSLARRCGFADPRLVEDRPLEIQEGELRAKIGNARFFSATYRLFRLEHLESACEDYGQAVIYRGTLPESPARFDLDKHHHIDRDRVFPVCGNTWRMLRETRFREHFEFLGGGGTHHGIFAGCGAVMPFDPQRALSSGACC